MPVEQIIIDLPEKSCPETGEGLVKIGEEVTHKLAFKPGSYFIKEIIRPKYAHPKKEELGIFTADLPSIIIPRCRADESFLATVITQKYGAYEILAQQKRLFGHPVGLTFVASFLRHRLIRLLESGYLRRSKIFFYLRESLECF